MRKLLFCLVLLSVSVTAFTKTPEMVFVKGGKFIMGNDSSKKNERPAHSVNLNDFYIGKFEVTISEFLEFLFDYEREDFKKTKRYAKYDKQGDLKLLKDEVAGNPECAMYSVNWYLAIDFCNWLSEKDGLDQCYTVDDKEINCDFSANGYRLPTEAEWEYAARGGSMSKGYIYSGSDSFGDVAWTKDNASKIQKAGIKKPNELGIYDMSGNVKEWCWDTYDNDYYKKSVTENPTGPTKNSINKVIRGGGWKDKFKESTVTFRNFNPRSDRDKDLGFRIVKNSK